MGFLPKLFLTRFIACVGVLLLLPLPPAAGVAPLHGLPSAATLITMQSLEEPVWRVIHPLTISLASRLDRIVPRVVPFGGVGVLLMGFFSNAAQAARATTAPPGFEHVGRQAIYHVVSGNSPWTVAKTIVDARGGGTQGDILNLALEIKDKFGDAFYGGGSFIWNDTPSVLAHLTHSTAEFFLEPVSTPVIPLNPHLFDVVQKVSAIPPDYYVIGVIIALVTTWMLATRFRPAIRLWKFITWAWTFPGVRLTVGPLLLLQGLRPYLDGYEPGHTARGFFAQGNYSLWAFMGFSAWTLYSKRQVLYQYAQKAGSIAKQGIVEKSKIFREFLIVWIPAQDRRKTVPLALSVLILIPGWAGFWPLHYAVYGIFNLVAITQIPALWTALARRARLLTTRPNRSVIRHRPADRTRWHAARQLMPGEILSASFFSWLPFISGHALGVSLVFILGFLSLALRQSVETLALRIDRHIMDHYVMPRRYLRQLGQALDEISSQPYATRNDLNEAVDGFAALWLHLHRAAYAPKSAAWDYYWRQIEDVRQSSAHENTDTIHNVIFPSHGPDGAPAFLWVPRANPEAFLVVARALRAPLPAAWKSARTLTDAYLHAVPALPFRINGFKIPALLNPLRLVSTLRLGIPSTLMSLLFLIDEPMSPDLPPVSSQVYEARPLRMAS